MKSKKLIGAVVAVAFTQLPASLLQVVVKSFGWRESLTPQWFEFPNLAYVPPTAASDLRLEAAAGFLELRLDWALIGIALTLFVLWVRDKSK